MKRIIVGILAALLFVQMIEGNVLFRFALDFHIKSEDNETIAECHINKTISLENSEVIINDAADRMTDEADDSKTLALVTVGPPISDIWARQHKLNAVANDKYLETRDAIEKLKNELLPFVGRSDYIAEKVKPLIHYLNEVKANDNGGGDNSSIKRKFVILRKFVGLVDDLRVVGPNATGGGDVEMMPSKSSLDVAVMNLAMQKYRIDQLQTEVKEQVMQAEEAWQRYVKEKLVEVAV